VHQNEVVAQAAEKKHVAQLSKLSELAATLVRGEDLVKVAIATGDEESLKFLQWHSAQKDKAAKLEKEIEGQRQRIAFEVKRAEDAKRVLAEKFAEIEAKEKAAETFQDEERKRLVEVALMQSAELEKLRAEQRESALQVATQVKTQVEQAGKKNAVLATPTMTIFADGPDGQVVISHESNVPSETKRPLNQGVSEDVAAAMGFPKGAARVDPSASKDAKLDPSHSTSESKKSQSESGKLSNRQKKAMKKAAVSAASSTSLTTDSKTGESSKKSVGGSSETARGEVKATKPPIVSKEPQASAQTQTKKAQAQTKKCRTWEKTGKCSFGDKCQFLHSAQPSQVLKNKEHVKRAKEGHPQFLDEEWEKLPAREQKAHRELWPSKTA